MKRISIWIAVVMMMTATSAFATSKTYNFNGWFADESSVANGEYALASQAAAEVCPSYGSWTDSFQPFTYTLTEFDDIWKDYSAANVNFSVTCTYESVNYTFSGAWFADEGSVQDGENAIQNDLWQDTCGGGNHWLTNMHFNTFYWTLTEFDDIWKDYSASSISGSFTCDE
jgi:uncharacterized protein YozE (UPF0346 family)